MILLKACPRCHGDLYLEEDYYGRYFNCLQCGLEVPVQLRLVPNKTAARELVTATATDEAA